MSFFKVSLVITIFYSITFASLLVFKIYYVKLYYAALNLDKPFFLWKFCCKKWDRYVATFWTILFLNQQRHDVVNFVEISHIRSLSKQIVQTTQRDWKIFDVLFGLQLDSLLFKRWIECVRIKLIRFRRETIFA